MKAAQLLLAILFILTFKLTQFFLPGTEILPYFFMIPLIMIVGIPHGATDHILENLVNHKIISARISVSFLIKYLTPMILFGILWWWFPTLSLIAFILISSLHFGETQWEKIRINRPNISSTLYHVMVAAWGIALLSSLFLLYPADFNNFTLGLTKNTSVKLITEIFSISLIASLITWTSISYIIEDKKTWMYQLVEFSVIIFLFSISGLLIGFTVFFVFWHSIDAINLQLLNIKKIVPDFDLKTFIKVAWPISLISVAGMGILLLTINVFNIPVATLLFILISIITIPHHISVEKFYSFSRKNN